MPLSVYLSYSFQDREIVNSLYSILKQNEIEVYPFEKDFPSGPIRTYESIMGFIQKSDIIIFFLNQNNIASPSINQEIGIARGLQKIIIPIVEAGVEFPYELRDLQYVILDRYNPYNTINQINQIALNIKSKKSGDSALGILLLLGAIGLILALSKEEE